MTRFLGLSLFVSFLCHNAAAQSESAEVLFGADTIATEYELARLLVGTNARIVRLSGPDDDFAPESQSAERALLMRRATGLVYDAAAADLRRAFWVERLSRHGVPVIAVCRCRTDRDWRVGSLRRMYDFIAKNAPELKPQLDQNLRRELQALRPERSIPFVFDPTLESPRVSRIEFSLSALGSNAP